MSKSYSIPVVAAELNLGIQEVVRRCNGALFEDEHGMRQVPGHVFSELKSERDARWTAEREAARQRRENRQPNPTRQRVQAIKLHHDPDAEQLARAGAGWREQ